jgi:hypothetical protein
MGAADDIKKGLTKALTSFTAQQKAEEKSWGAMRWRKSRMMEVRGKSHTKAADEVMKECYMKVSDNNALPAHARQIFYVARPLIEEQTDKPLKYPYFSQTLLPNYIKKHAAECANWDVVYDDRGHFEEPHTGRVIGLGTLSVRAYLRQIRRMKLTGADFAPAFVETYGPSGCFGALLYVEKEGFMPLFRRVKLAERFDIAIMSSKGMSVTAARELAEGICSNYGLPLLVLHDFDRSGIIIKDTLENDTRRYTYTRPPRVIDFGLTLDDIEGLLPEPADPKIGDERLEQAGVSQEAIDFLSDQKVELNAMTSRQLINFVEGKLQQHGIGKVVPDAATLAGTYKMFAANDRLAEAFDELKEKLEDESEDQEAPADLEDKVRDKLQEKPDITWHRAVKLILDPDAPEDEDDNSGEYGDDKIVDINKLVTGVLGDSYTTIGTPGNDGAGDEDNDIDDEDLSDIDE